MGNNNSYKEKKVTIPALVGEWVSAGKTDYCDLVKNTRTGVIAEQYHIPIETRLTAQQNEEIYQERRFQNDNLVTVYHIEKETNQYLCQGKEFLTVKVQRIPYRLSEVNNLSFSQTLYILRESCIGYRAITDFYGPIIITDEMIGFTSDNRVKVWLNEQFAHNLPHQNAHLFLRQPNNVQQKLPNTISQLFSVIEQHCQNGLFPDPFGKAYRQYPIQTFTEALQFIEDYAAKKNINLRHSLSSNSTVSAKTDISLFKQKHIQSKISDPTSLHQPIVQKKEYVRMTKNTPQLKRYFPNPQIKIQKRMIPPLPFQQVKIQSLKQTKIDSKPSSNFTSSVSSNPLPIRKISQASNHFKILSPRDQLTFTPVTSTKTSANSNIRTPAQVRIIQQNNHRISQHTPITLVKSIPTQQVRYSLADSKNSNQISITSFKDLGRFKSPSKIYVRDPKLPPPPPTDIQKGIRTKYDSILTTQPRTSFGSIDNTPKVITFNNYSKGQKVSIKKN